MRSKYKSTEVRPCHDLKRCGVCGSVPILVLNMFIDRLGAYVHCPNDCHVTAMRHCGKDEGVVLVDEVKSDWNKRRFL